MLQIPERFAEVNIVSLRILKSEELTPELVYLLRTCSFDLIDLRLLIDQLAPLKDRYKKFYCRVIIDHLAFPDCVRIEYLERLAVRDRSGIGSSLSMIRSAIAFPVSFP